MERAREGERKYLSLPSRVQLGCWHHKADATNFELCRHSVNLLLENKRIFCIEIRSQLQIGGGTIIAQESIRERNGVQVPAN